LLLAYQGFEQGVATFYDLPGNSYLRIALSFSPLCVQPRASHENSLYDPAARRWTSVGNRVERL